jgi:hypothetical protein
LGEEKVTIVLCAIPPAVKRGICAIGRVKVRVVV